ncbi:M20 family metallo-hydrolase [Poseidonocella sp. HB161398]|uniref:M20 family metallo-hydrolase n=1 Tax=Poseidonocella sp. HB161398 TaxID=2320855 RepID=UPI001108CF67|nr:M20 family metallo-hydrolase [Poseidonocella sp. HB161398]
MTDWRWGLRARDMLEALAGASAPGPGVTRLPFTPEHDAALALLRGWMEAAGLLVRLDAAGTLSGRAEGPEGAPVLLMGSHQDSVPGGGAFDGIMGVVLPILALEKLREEGRALPVAVEVLAFADEEGVRFPTALLGSRALAGTADPAVLEMADRQGVTLGGALAAFGGDPGGVAALARDPSVVAGFVETHIEQGPVLEQAGEPLGIVTAICGIERHAVTLTGRTGHAGTVPMAARRDALAGAAALVTEVRRMGLDTPGLRATVGELHVVPNAVNAIPGEVRLTVELRAPSDELREAAGTALHLAAAQIAREAELDLVIGRSYVQPAVPCDPALSARLEAAARAAGAGVPSLPSGATHDASAMAGLCPVAMLFLRCRDGASHVPEEHADPADMGVAVAALAGLVAGFGAEA